MARHLPSRKGMVQDAAGSAGPNLTARGENAGDRLEPYGPGGQAIYERLVTAAGAREFVFYNQVGADLGLNLNDASDRQRLWEVLTEISRSEVSIGRPMLTAICVQEQDHLPGIGFLVLGEELGQVEPGEDEVSFAVRQIKAVHDHWSDLPPFGETGEGV